MARKALEVNTNCMSFTPRDLACLGLPFWHMGLRKHPALQRILSVLRPVLQHIPLRGMPFPRKGLAFVTRKKKIKISKLSKNPTQKAINQG